MPIDAIDLQLADARDARRNREWSQQGRREDFIVHHIVSRRRMRLRVDLVGATPMDGDGWEWYGDGDLQRRLGWNAAVGRVQRHRWFRERAEPGVRQACVRGQLDGVLHRGSDDSSRLSVRWRCGLVVSAVPDSVQLLDCGRPQRHDQCGVVWLVRTAGQQRILRLTRPGLAKRATEAAPDARRTADG